MPPETGPAGWFPGGAYATTAWRKLDSLARLGSRLAAAGVGVRRRVSTATSCLGLGLYHYGRPNQDLFLVPHLRVPWKSVQAVERREGDQRHYQPWPNCRAPVRRHGGHHGVWGVCSHGRESTPFSAGAATGGQRQRIQTGEPLTVSRQSSPRPWRRASRGGSQLSPAG
jgi:hypothetical protein